MPTRAEYQAMAEALDWAGLRDLLAQIRRRDTPGWDPGKAFEYLVLRAFQLDGADVRYPYAVQLYGQDEVAEEIDGSVRFTGLYSLVESKDESGNISVGPIAKMRSQLLRRPAGTIGMVFCSSDFTASAYQLTQYMMPQAILLWEGTQTEAALASESICKSAEQKYRWCVDYGIASYTSQRGTIT